ncbi:hypothetical protein PTI98_012990 [Pleurotus ostreatus]|nr:hypothetical protein PTI98_012990 [Pleurotus ostreatus]
MITVNDDFHLWAQPNEASYCPQKIVGPTLLFAFSITHSYVYRVVAFYSGMSVPHATFLSSIADPFDECTDSVACASASDTYDGREPVVGGEFATALRGVTLIRRNAGCVHHNRKHWVSFDFSLFTSLLNDDGLTRQCSGK